MPIVGYAAVLPKRGQQRKRTSSLSPSATD